MRQRKDAVEIGHGEQLCPAVFDPLRLGESLTLGTVAIYGTSYRCSARIRCLNTTLSQYARAAAQRPCAGQGDSR
jgi:hypothetical protein